jgi:hypothetical protein
VPLAPCTLASKYKYFLSSSTLYPKSYLPSFEWGDQQGPSSDEMSCIAQRGEILLPIAFGHLGKAIFNLNQSVSLVLFHQIAFGRRPGAWRRLLERDGHQEE